MTVMFYLVVHGIIVAIWYASFLWTPWATFVLSSVALTLTGYAVLFDRSWIEQIAESAGDRLSGPVPKAKISAPPPPVR